MSLSGVCHHNEHTSSGNHQCALQRPSKLFKGLRKVLNVWAVAAAIEQAAMTCYDTLLPFYLH